MSASYHIPDLDLEATEGYIRHRLRHAGGTGEEFTDDAIEMIYWQSGGVPRLVNKLADFAMVYAVTAEKARVDGATVEEVMGDNLFLNTAQPAKDAAE